MLTRGYQHSALITILWLSFWGGILGGSSGKALAQEEQPVLTFETSEISPLNTSTPETPNSETPTPETPTPETSTPETSDSETSSSETSDSETSSSETSDSETSSSETSSSETSSSETSDSEISTPDAPKLENIDSSLNSENAEPASESDRTDESEASSFPNADPPLATETSSFNALALRHAFPGIDNTPPPQLYPSHFPSLEHTPLGDRIRAFTVTVWGETSWGTGVIIQQQPTPGGWDYWVVTNSHVIRDDSVNIQTFDRQVHNTLIVLDDRIGGYDLAILRFSSSRPYNVASVQTEVQLNETTIAVGFPFDRADLATPENSEFHWTEGEIVHILDESLVDGYQFAYSNAIEKGMSGGPVLNLRGELIAINGLHAYPLWGNPFVYPDGRPIEPELNPPPEESSWSIPIATVLERGTALWVNQVTLRPGCPVFLRSNKTAEIGMNP